ncbi:hypothetical protein DS901_06870 [Loktanella sp. D2R18]|nr:hypothetical protein DS901_06870 [Loktanella sp. D2R18]
MPECALYGIQIAFICQTTQSLWRSIIRYEQFLIDTPGKHRCNSKKRKMALIIKSLADMLLHASLGSPFRPIDCFDNRYFKVPRKLGYATRGLRKPFAAAHLVERRKALDVIINSFERKLFDLARLALPF